MTLIIIGCAFLLAIVFVSGFSFSIILGKLKKRTKKDDLTSSLPIIIPAQSFTAIHSDSKKQREVLKQKRNVTAYGIYGSKAFDNKHMED